MSNTNPEGLYYSTNSAQLSKGEAGGTDIETADPRDLAPVITRVSNAASPSVTAVVTIDETITGTITEETKEGTDLTNDIVV